MEKAPWKYRRDATYSARFHRFEGHRFGAELVVTSLIFMVNVE
jgi:hypothetical protein